MMTHILCTLLAKFVLLGYVTGQNVRTFTAIVQNDEGCTSYYSPQQYTVQEDNVHIRSQTNQFYTANQNCIVIIKGKAMHQWEVKITQLDVDKNAQVEKDVPVFCNDYLKIFNGPRVDNARLIPHMPKRGLCWRTGLIPQKFQNYKTSQNFVTLQFKTDGKFDAMTGFTVSMRQYRWTNNPNPYPNPGGWNDGTLNEFQQNWDSQPIVPGELGPGYDYSDYDLDMDTYGATCYECQLCQLDNFSPSRSNAAQKKGCFMCSKEWDDRYAQARRKCYTQRQYTNLLLSYNEQVKDDQGKLMMQTGCNKFINDYGRGINYCFCETELCNNSDRSKISTSSLLFSCIITLLFVAGK